MKASAAVNNTQDKRKEAIFGRQMNTFTKAVYYPKADSRCVQTTGSE